MTHILLELESVPDLIPEVLLLERTRWVCQYVVKALKLRKQGRAQQRREEETSAFTSPRENTSSILQCLLTHL